MPRLTKLYTRTGDDGSTALGSRERVGKDNPRVAAYGEVDELNSALGLALALGLVPRLMEVVPGIQNELFNLGSDLAFPPDAADVPQVPRIEARHIAALEGFIDELSAAVGPLENFILPGGAPGAAALQLARAICRRAEREVVALGRSEPLPRPALTYLNRLSDALFVMARFENHSRGVAEPLWDTHA
ncbi:MAG: cob(I)yrinic acid a,c-diamide adenosyltransferase [Candidatus Promineifilaceae bacterium]